uniref:Pyrin domain-containing protein n=1 Tax=Hucho hucho TaxID=62062 RepID=A0A4W5LDW8_9TELE
MLDVPALLLTTLEELTEEQLKIFQSNLSIGWLLGFPPIPSRQLENADGQDTVDQMVKRYDPEGAVRNTLMILRWMNLDDLAEQLERDHTRDSNTVFPSQALYPSSVVMGKPYRFRIPSVQDSLQVRGLVHMHNTLTMHNTLNVSKPHTVDHSIL